MADFYRIAYQNKQGMIEIFPKFIIGNSSDLMIRGGDFYAVWLVCGLPMSKTSFE